MKNDYRIPSILLGVTFVLAILSTPASAENWETGPPIPEGAEEVLGTGVGSSMVTNDG